MLGPLTCSSPTASFSLVDGDDARNPLPCFTCLSSRGGRRWGRGTRPPQPSRGWAVTALCSGAAPTPPAPEPQDGRESPLARGGRGRGGAGAAPPPRRSGRSARAEPSVGQPAPLEPQGGWRTGALPPSPPPPAAPLCPLCAQGRGGSRAEWQRGPAGPVQWP